MKPFKRLMANGKTSPFYYASVVVNGKRVVRSLRVTTMEEALKKSEGTIDCLQKCQTGAAFLSAYIDSHRAITKNELMAMRKSIDAAIVEKFGGGPIRLSEAAKKFEGLPWWHAMPRGRFVPQFVAWLRQNHPSLLTLNDVKTSHVQEFLVELRQKDGKAWKSVSGARSVLASMFKRLAKESGLEENPVDGVHLATKSVTTRIAFTDEEMGRILANADETLYPLIFLIRGTALRLKDACHLRWAEVDIQNGRIHRTQCKTGDVAHITPLPDCLRWLDALPRDSEFVLPKLKAQYEKRGTLTMRMNALLDRLKIEHAQEIAGNKRRAPARGIHGVRHWHLSKLAASGVPGHVVQAQAGHRDSASTQRYLHTNQQTDRLLRTALATMAIESVVVDVEKLA